MPWPSLHISGCLYSELKAFIIACFIIFTQIRATIGILDSSDPEKSAIFAAMPALDGGREGIQLLRLDMQ